MEPIRPSVWRSAKRNTALSVSAVVIAKDEYCGGPPGVVRGSASQAATAASVNQTVRLPRWRKAASYSAQFATLCFCLGMWWRRSWFSLNGKVGFRGSGAGRTSYATQPPPPPSRSVQQGYFGAHSSALSVTERVNLRGTEVFASRILGLIVPCRALRSADAEALPRIGHG